LVKEGDQVSLAYAEDRKEKSKNAYTIKLVDVDSVANYTKLSDPL
jgi:hypothetical protein